MILADCGCWSPLWRGLEGQTTHAYLGQAGPKWQIIASGWFFLNFQANFRAALIEDTVSMGLKDHLGPTGTYRCCHFGAHKMAIVGLGTGDDGHREGSGSRHNPNAHQTPIVVLIRVWVGFHLIDIEFIVRHSIVGAFMHYDAWHDDQKAQNKERRQ